MLSSYRSVSSADGAMSASGYATAGGPGEPSVTRRYAQPVADGDAFEALVAEALDELPAWVAERLDNVEVLVEDRPPRGEPGLLGRYHGVPLTQRGTYGGVLPDTITLYRSTIER